MSLLLLLIILHHIIKFPSDFIDFRKDFLIQNFRIDLCRRDVCMSQHFGNTLNRNSFGQHNRSETVPAAMCCETLIYPTQCGNFLQIAVLLILSTLYQSITNSKIYRGNDLVTVLLTEVCDHLLVR